MHYETLNVPIDASAKDIRKAYRRLALKYHTDIKGGSSQAFIEITEAWSILGNPAKKKKYDESLIPILTQKAHKQREFSSFNVDCYTIDHASILCTLEQLLSNNTFKIKMSNNFIVSLNYPAVYVRDLTYNINGIQLNVYFKLKDLVYREFTFIPDLNGVCVTILKDKKPQLINNNFYKINTPYGEQIRKLGTYDDSSKTYVFLESGIIFIQPITNRKMQSLLIIDTKEV